MAFHRLMKMKHTLYIGKYKHSMFSMIFIIILKLLGDYRIGKALGCKCQVFGGTGMIEEGGSRHFCPFICRAGSLWYLAIPIEVPPCPP